MIADLRRHVLGLAITACAVWGGHAQAQSVKPNSDNYPTRPVRVVVPFLAGGSTDTLGRVTAQTLSERFGQQFLVENVAGAGGTIGAIQAARAAPDGYTPMVGTPGSMTINPHLQANLAYDPLRDFVPVALIGDTAGVVIVRKDPRRS